MKNIAIFNSQIAQLCLLFDFLLPLSNTFYHSITVVTNQTLVAVATSDISFAGAVPTDLVARSSHHNDAARVTVAS